MSSSRSSAARRAALIVAAALTAACASQQSTATTNQAGATRDNHYVLTAASLQEAGTSNLYDAIQKLRPEFLRTRGTQTISAADVPTSSRSGPQGSGGTRNSSTGQAVPILPYGLRVYDNNILLSGVEDLKRIDTKNVLEVRFVPGPEAGVKYGTNHQGGVIFVKTQ